VNLRVVETPRVRDPVVNSVFDAVLAHQGTAALVAAVKLDIFTVIGPEMMASDAIASSADTTTPHRF
jgi:hypothetical protein